MRRTPWLLGIVLGGCAMRTDVDRTDAQIRELRIEARRIEAHLRLIEAELARVQMRRAEVQTPPGAAPVEHVVVIRVETPDTVPDVDVDPEEDEPVAPIRELISPWPPEPRARPDVGTLRIGAAGFFCAASIDGIPVGNTPLAIATVRTGEHEVTCTNPALGYERTKTVRVERGERSIVRFAR